MINLGRTYIAWCLAFGLLLCSFMVLAQQQRIELRLDKDRISADETVILSVRAFGMDEEIDYSALTKDFDVTERSSNREFTLQLGRKTSLVEWVLELLPNKSGVLEIPPITVGPEQSRPLTLLVDEPATGADRDIFLESSVDNPKPYVHAQLIYTLRAFVDAQLVQGSLQVPQLDDIALQPIHESDDYQEVVDGRTYTVSEFRYAIFPQSSGAFTIPPSALQALVVNDEAQTNRSAPRTKRLIRRADAIQIDVQARPDESTSSWWLPAKQVKLNSEWSEPIDNLSIDQPITRTVHLMATGVGDTQLPEITVPEPEHISIYADSPVASTSVNENGLLAQQTNTWAVIPQTSGQLIFPEVRVSWFDTTTGQAKVAILPEEILNVKDNAATAAASVEPTTTQAIDATPETSDSDALVELPSTDANLPIDNSLEPDSADTESLANVVNAVEDSVLVEQLNRWRTATYALLAAWVLSFGALWFWVRKRLGAVVEKAPNTPTETRSMRFQRRAGSNASIEPIRAACESGDASTISKALLAWGAMVWPENVPTNTAQIAKRLQSKKLAASLYALDAQQFKPDASVNSVAFSAIPDQLKQAVDQYQADVPNPKGVDALPAL